VASLQGGTGEASSDTARLETFSDGVMAIAITLLVLEVRIPRGGDLASALLRQWPSYVAYATSFLTIGVIWANHHRMFRLIERTDHPFLVINVLFLMVVAFVPFPTAVVAEHIRESAARTPAAVLYGATMFLLAVMFNVLWNYAAAGHRLLVDGLDPEAIRKSVRGYRAGPVAYGAATLIALVYPVVSVAVYMALAVYYMLPGSGPG
jgi:uncharacterized membrane protein